MSVVGAASAAGVIALAITPAAGVAKPKHKSGSHSNLVTCTSSVTIEVSPGQQQVLPSQTPATQEGSIRCGKKIGHGLQMLSYTIPDSGNEIGAFTTYLKNGTLKGKFNLTPQEGTLSPSGTTATFGYTAFTGVLTHLSGTGVFASAKGAGTATCTSQDGLHFVCVEKL